MVSIILGLSTLFAVLVVVNAFVVNKSITKLEEKYDSILEYQKEKDLVVVTKIPVKRKRKD